MSIQSGLVAANSFRSREVNMSYGSGFPNLFSSKICDSQSMNGLSSAELQTLDIYSYLFAPVVALSLRHFTCLLCCLLLFQGLQEVYWSIARPGGYSFCMSQTCQCWKYKHNTERGLREWKQASRSAVEQRCSHFRLQIFIRSARLFSWLGSYIDAPSQDAGIEKITSCVLGLASIILEYVCILLRY